MDDSPIEVAVEPAASLPKTRYPAFTPRPYVSPVSRVKVLRIALIAVAVAAVLAGFAAVQRQQFASEALRLGAVTPDRLDALAHRWALVEFLVAVSVAGATAAWLAWFARVYGNLQPLGARLTAVSRSMAVVCCAVPVLNLVMAPRLWLEAWRSSESDSGSGDGAERRIDTRPTALLLAWPAIGLVAVVLAVLGERKTDRALDYLGPVRTAAPLQILAAAALLVAVPITLRLAEALTARQEGAARRAISEEPS